jgi:hypothetical protein
MKKILLILTVAAIACSPLFVSSAQAAPGKSHKTGHHKFVHKKAAHHLAKRGAHFARHHKTA